MPRIVRLQSYAVNVTPKTNWVFMEAVSDDGLTGIGEASLNGWEAPLLACAEMLARDVVGSACDTAADIARLAQIFPHSPGGLLANAVKSALEQALTDLLAQRAGLPIHAWLGGARRTKVPVYANINRATMDRSAHGFRASAQRAVAAGFRAVKVAPFDGVVSQDRASSPFTQRIRAGIERVLAVRDAVPATVSVLVDCHWRFDEASAAEVIDALAPAGLFWLECPVSEQPLHWDAIVRLRRRANDRGMRLAGAETITGVEQVRPMLERGLYDVIMPDLKYCGGYAAMLAIADLAARHDVRFSPHNPSGPVCNLASVHACMAADDCLVLEHQLAESPLYESLVHGAGPALVEGSFVAPERAGLGAQLDRELAQAHPWQRLPRGANLDERLG